MYGDVESALLWLRLFDKYFVNECNLKSRKDNSCIFFNKYYKGKLELVMLFHVDDVFMSGNPETLNNIK